MKQHSKRILGLLLTLALVLSLLPGAGLTVTAESSVNFVKTSSSPTAEELAGMITYSEAQATELYNSAEFQALGEGLGLIYNYGEAAGEYKVIFNMTGNVDNESLGLDMLATMISFNLNLYYVSSGSVTPPTPTNPAVYYRYYTLDTSSRTVSAAVSSTTDYTLVSAGDANGSWNGGWHVANGNVVLNGNVNLTGTVYLILCDGASLTVTKGLYSNTSGTRLVIYPGFMSSGTRSAPEIQGTGTLTATGTQGRSAIGYELSLEVHGGVIEANGFRFAAGIGGIAGKDGCDVVIYDGTVNATGGENAAGIGGGLRGSGGNVEIYGGTVNAVSGADDVAGIGAGAGGSEQGTLSLSGTELSVSNDGETWTTASDSSVRGRYMRVQAIDLSAPVSADDGYTDGFEGANAWTLQNGELTNAWYVGSAVSNGGSKALYISNDGGESNAYSTGESTFVFAEKRFRFEGGYYDFAYDWRNNGESNFDYLRVALIPESAEVQPGNSPYGFGNSALPDGWIALDGGSQLSGQNDWQHMSVVGQSVPAGVYRVAFLWWNDSSVGMQSPAAIDNFSVAVSDYEPPAAVSADAGYTDGFEGANAWTLQNGDRTNAWVVGSAVSNGGSKALYISMDRGASNFYDTGESAFVFAEKRFSFDGGNYNFEYDWHSNGEFSFSRHYDFLRVALVPDDETLTPGASSPLSFDASNLPSGWIALDGGSQLNLNSEWQHASFENIEVPTGVYRVAFLWRNDGSGGNNPPAAVDNFSVVNSNAPVPGAGIARNLTTNAVYSDLQTAFDEAGAGDIIQLIDNVVLDATVNVPRTLTLDLNGCSVTVDSAAACTAFKFQGTDDYITFTLNDSSDAVYYYYIDETTHLGVVAPEEVAAAHELHGSFTGGYITGGVASVYDNSDPTWPRIGGGAIQALGKSDLVLKNGAIIGNQANADPSGRGACSGGGVYLQDDSVFYMEGGAIIGNTSTKSGGGVKLNYCARNNGVSRPSGVNCGMYISGGEIKHNGVGAFTASYDGGAGIHMSGSELYLRDGSYYIFDNYTYREDGTKRQSNVLVYNSIGFALENTSVAPVFGEGTKIGVSRGSTDGKGQISNYLNRQNPAPQQVIKGVMEADDETLMVSIRPADGSLPYQLELVDRPPEPEVTYFKGYSLSLRGDIALYFYIDLNDIAPEDATVHFTWGNGPVRNSLDRALSEITPVAVGDASYYPVSVPVSAAEINDKITAVLMNGGDTVETDEASVADYARRIIANEGGEFDEGYAALPELQALCEAMLIYGAKAQLQFGYNTGDLADAGMDYTLEDADPASISGGTVEKDLSAFGLEYFGSTLQLQSTVTHRVYFKVVNQALLDATNVRYGSRELTKAAVTDKSFIGNPEGDYIYIDLVDVTARRVTSPYTMTFTNGKKTVKMNVNAATYIKQALNGSDATLRATVTALYNYNQAAVAYFEARDAQ